ncbi:S1C family serine protease, partial [Polaribacter sp.]|uniref:S1C family serine protease n=1 Tax=Polaribacter sp. TaxID=1920175 RepID=UPI003F6B9784
SNIAKKIIDDILEFGAVQEAILGININNQEKDIDGVKIESVAEDGGAENAGLQSGDIITQVNNVKISKYSELRGQLTAKRPGESVNITVNRDGAFITKNVKLSKKDTFVSSAFGIILKDLSKKDLKKYDISKGVKIYKNANKYLDYYGVKEGFIITKINKKEVSNASEASKILDYTSSRNEPVYLEVINLKGERERYAIR